MEIVMEEINGEEIIEYDFCGFVNSESAEEMKKGKIGKLIGIGNSMTPIIKSRQPVICSPITDKTVLKKGDIVFCKVRGNHYLHKIHAVKGKNEEFLIGNNHGSMNGWAKRSNIFGLVTKIL